MTQRWTHDHAGTPVDGCGHRVVTGAGAAAGRRRLRGRRCARRHRRSAADRRTARRSRPRRPRRRNGHVARGCRTALGRCSRHPDRWTHIVLDRRRVHRSARCGRRLRTASRTRTALRTQRDPDRDRHEHRRAQPTRGVLRCVHAGRHRPRWVRRSRRVSPSSPTNPSTGRHRRRIARRCRRCCDRRTRRVRGPRR